MRVRGEREGKRTKSGFPSLTRTLLGGNYKELPPLSTLLLGWFSFTLASPIIEGEEGEKVGRGRRGGGNKKEYKVEGRKIGRKKKIKGLERS